MIEAIVLAGGLGTRLKGVVADVPKPMAPINNKPFLQYILNILYRQNIRRVILSTGYKHEMIEEYFGQWFNNDMELVYCIEKEPLGTGGAIRQALDQVKQDTCLIVNGDTIFDISIEHLINEHTIHKADLTIALKEMNHFDRYGTVDLQDSIVKGFYEKKPTDKGYINGGIYVLSRQALLQFELSEKFSFEADFMQKYFGVLNVRGTVFDSYFIDIGIPEDYFKAQSELKSYE